MLTPEDAKRSAAFTFNAAADVFDSSALGFRDDFGRKTVEKLGIGEGARVLDVCCGTGSSAIPAAELVGPSGFVIGIDLADKLLVLARKKARRCALENNRFPCRGYARTGLFSGKLRCGGVCFWDLFPSGHAGGSAATMAPSSAWRETCHYDLGTKRS